MIPINLTVKNFMSYREPEQTLDLEGIKIACLSGPNGHGKTTLLDAITWVLWGKARSRTQEELVHQGQKDMMVELIFVARGQRYRVSRLYSKNLLGSRGRTELDLAILSEGTPTSIMGATIRDTERQIVELLGMDYDTFINTSYLRQGDADRFTRSKPAERKRTLAEVLRLSYYEHLEKKSRDRSRKIKESILEKKAVLSAREAEVEEKPVLTTQVEISKGRINELEPKIQVLTKKLHDLNSQKESNYRDQQEKERLLISLSTNKQELCKLNSQKKDWQERISQVESLLSRSEEILSKKEQLLEKTGSLKHLTKQLTQVMELEASKSRLEKIIAIESERIMGLEKQYRQRIDSDLRPTVDQIPNLEQQLQKIRQELTECSNNSDQLSTDESKIKKLSDELSSLETINTALKDNMSETRGRYDLLGQANAHCPLCSQPLDETSKLHLSKEYEKSGVESRSTYQNNLIKIKTLKTNISSETVRINKNRAELQSQMKYLEGELYSNDQLLKLGKDNQIKMSQEVEDHRIIAHKLSCDDYAIEERILLRKIEDTLKEISFDQTEHHKLEQEVQELSPYLKLSVELEQSHSSLDSLKQGLQTNLEMTSTRIKEIQLCETTLKELSTRLSSIVNLQNESLVIEKELSEINKDIQANISKRDSSLQQLERLAKYEQDILDITKYLTGSLEESAIYDELASAFGPNGIQALMIEQTVPQIEEISNDLLSKLTDNRMAVKLEIKDGRIDKFTGLPSEELDISVSDEKGTRSYETFSGGEAFRIDFALRIALSKLLASRSGTPLPILFIDEGFGSQDNSGQERLTEAIQSIQDEFEKIIVITHVDTMKESFEHRIEVFKTPEGSTIQVS